jgi:hypothetical protein
MVLELCGDLRCWVAQAARKAGLWWLGIDYEMAATWSSIIFVYGKEEGVSTEAKDQSTNQYDGHIHMLLLFLSGAAERPKEP